MFMNRFRSFFAKLFRAGTEQPQVSRKGNIFTRLFNKEERAERRAAKQREKERRAMQDRLETAAREARHREAEAKAVRAASEIPEKASDFARMEADRAKAFETFKERYDWNISKKDWDNMWDVWGGISQEIKDAYGGSDPKKPGGSNLVYMYKELNSEADRKRFPEILNEIYETAPQGSNQEQLIDMVYNKIEELNSVYGTME